MSDVVDSFCRICNNGCAIKVTVTAGVATKVTGNRDNPLYAGYSCVKGRSQPAYLASPDRVRHSLKRGDDGSFTRIPVEQAMDEIAAKLTQITDTHGPRSVAGYAGTMALAKFPTAMPMFTALMDAIGTPLRFDPNTLDKGGKQVAQSFLGAWGAPSQGFDEPGAILLIGINPLLTYTGFPAGSPYTWLAATMERGCTVIVIDPRRTEVAKKATLHLQPIPGHDVPIMAALINVILTERLYDAEFLTGHVRNVDALREAVAPFTPEAVAGRAGVEAHDMRRAARMYAAASRGYTMAGTGPNMAGGGSLVEYLVLVLETLCGRWLRAGEVMRQAPTLLPEPVDPKARATDAGDWRLPELMRVRGLRQTRAGMPLAALPDEVLLPGPGQVRALLSWGGNPAVAFPDQGKTLLALDDLDLLVAIDPWMSETARRAHYVIAPTMPLESPSITTLLDSLAIRATGYGVGGSYAQYTPAVANPPAGSDVVDDWEFFYGLLVRMGFEVSVRPAGTSPRVRTVTIDRKPSGDELLEILTAGSRVPLSVVKGRPGGDLYPDGLPSVAAAGPEDHGRLDVGSPEMLAALAQQRHAILVGADDSEFAFRLLCRRNNHTYNTSCNVPTTNRGVAYNPAFLNPADLVGLGIDEGDEIRIRSALDSIPAVAAADPHLRPGLVSMAFGYGPAQPGADVRRTGSSPSRLVRNDDVFDPYTGQPRMSNVPVAVERVGGHPSPTGA